VIVLATTDTVPGREILQTFGLVRGSAIRSRHVFHDFVEWLHNLVGGELRHYTKMLAEAREQAIDRMIEDARRLNADAVVDVRFNTSDIASGAAEVLAYGTAVKLG